MRDHEAHARLDRLEQLVNRGRGRASEALVPTYLTFDPSTGAIGADFTGLINALGLIIPAAPSSTTPGAPNRAVWLDPATGVIIGQMWSYYVAGAGTLIDSIAEQPTDGSIVDLRALDDTGAVQASFKVAQTARGQEELLMQAGVQGGTLLDSGFNSLFITAPQIGNGDRIGAFGGNFNVTIPANNVSQIQNFTFPTPFTAVPFLGSGCDVGNHNIAFGFDGPTSAGFEARVHWTDQSATHPATTVTFYWLAVGTY